MPSLPEAPTVRHADDAHRVQLILSQIDRLPTLPAVAAKVLQVTSASDSCAQDVVALIELDQSLTCRVLSLVNRSHRGTRADETSLSRAVVALGFNAIRNAVLSLQIYEAFPVSEAAPDSALDRLEFWKHSLATACAARLLASSSDPPVPPEDAFVAGLLHDLGKAALDACLPKSYARIIAETQARRDCICEVEQRILGMDHTIAGKRLARQWKLPDAYVSCTWLHHLAPEALPPSVAGRDLVRVVHLADEIARRQRIGFSGYNRAGDVAALAKQLGVDEEAIDAISAGLAEQVEEHCRIFGLGDVPAARIYAEALADANAELGRLNADLVESNQHLSRTSRCFDVLRHFHQAAFGEQPVVEICRAAARAFRETLVLSRAVVCFACSDEGRLLRCAIDGPVADAADRPSHCFGTCSGDVVLERPWQPAVESCDAVLAVPPELQPICDQFGGPLAGSACRLIPICHDGQVVGGLIWSTDENSVGRLDVAPQDLRVVMGAFGMAIASAASREAKDKLLEELADVNRRLQSTRQELLRAKSLTMIAELATGAAHELNNPLAVIAGRAQMLIGTNPDEAHDRAMRTIADQAQRASDIVTGLVEFAKPERPATQTINLLSWLDRWKMRWLAESTLAADRFVLQIRDANVAVRVDPGHLTAIFDALACNSIEATTPATARLMVNSDSRASDDAIVVVVKDNGSGMSPEVLEHALDPFFSHRTAGRGRGLGLSRAYSLALANGGKLWLESALGAGTEVFIELPSAATESTAASPPERHTTTV